MIESELMRSCILEALRREPKTQYVNLKLRTAVVAAERELPIKHGTSIGRIVYGQTSLRLEDERRFRETVWALVIEGIIAQGSNEASPAWPFLSLSEYGEEYLADSAPTPYDPSDYFARLQSTGPLDSIEERYLPQALATFRKGLPDASAVMLGAVSEHLLILLAESITNNDPAVASVMTEKLTGNALPLLRELRLYFEGRLSELPRNLKEGVGTTFSGIATLIRVARNDAGHPRLEVVSREQAFTNLQLFPHYRQWVMDAIGWTRSQSKLK